MTTTSPQDQLIEAVTDLFYAEYHAHARPGMDEAEHDDCIRGALEAVIALVQDTQAVRAKLCEMTLHDDTGDLLDVGYMLAVHELQAWLADRG